ncbi:MAG: copper resistance protein CopC [Rhodoglobus sp.]|nr:copper resistance protein CopC [Rhodoglobus sp.]
MVRRTAALVLAIGVVVLGAAAPAQAHNSLVSSTPEVGSTITELPQAFSVTTNETLLDLSGDGAGFAMQVKDTDGAYYGDGCYSIVDATLSMGATLGEAGDYTLLWQVVSADGHPVSGEFDFTWAPAAGIEPSAGSPTPPSCGGEASGPVSTNAPREHANANLSDVLWIGGAIIAVAVAALIAFLVIGRRRRTTT